MFLCDNQRKFQTFLITLTLKQIFWKTKTFFKNVEYRFLVETTKIETNHFHWLYQKPILRQIEWGLQNGPITIRGVLPANNYFIFLENLFQR